MSFIGYIIRKCLELFGSGNIICNHFGSETQTVGSVTVSASGGGTGASLVGGWVNSKGGFIAMEKVEWTDINFSGNTTQMNGCA